MEPLELQTAEHADNQGHQDKAKQLKTPRLELASEFSSTGCLQPEPAIELLTEDIFDDRSDLDEEHTPEKAIIQSDFHDRKNSRHSQSDYESSCSSYRTHFSANRSGKLQDGFQKHGMIKHVAASENDHLQAKAISVRLQNEMWQDNRTESSLVQMLWRQIENLALKEKEVEQTLSKERIESLVSKVEEEVEFEGMVEDMCSRFKAEGEYLDIERRERDWERERREVRLEEEVELLRNKVEALEEEIKIAHTERDCALQKQTESNELIDNMKVSSGALQGQQNSGSHHTHDENILTISRPGRMELLDGGEESLLAALREMLCQAEEKAERDRRMLEESFQDEQQLWIENEQLLQNRISALERELNSTRDIIKEKESVISLERERRREYGLEFDRVLAFWREENSVHSATLERLKNIESISAKLAEKIKQLMTLYPARETELAGVLSELLMDLEKVENEKLEMGSPSEEQQLFEWELVGRWKSQRDLLEEERDKLQEKLELSTKMARDNEERMEKLWQEKEMNFVKQLSKLEALVANDDVVWNQTNATAVREKGLWECEVAAYKQAWQEEHEKVQSIMAEREQLMEEHTQEWSAVLEVREEELCSLKSAQKKLGSSLTTSKKRLLNLKRQLARHRKGFSKDSSLEIYRIDRNFDNIGGLCSDESDLDTSCSTDLSASKEQSQAADGEEYCMDVEQLANDISKEIGRLARELRQEQGRMERERTDVRIGTEQLKDERKELESKVAEALTLMEDMREQIKAKEGQMERERKQMDLILSSKTDEAEHLQALLNSKDHEIARSVRKFKEELNLIQKEVEKERKEREDVMDMHFTSRRKLIQEMKEKEARWEKEIEAMSQEIEQLGRDIDDKNQLILKLKKEGSGFHGKRDVEWQDLIGKIAGFDNQIAEAMLAIQSLKEELTAKENELQRARLERDSERKVAWIHEQVEAKDPQENSSIVGMEKEIDWGEREHFFSSDNEGLIKLLEAESADTADAMSILQGAVRELHWALRHSKGKGDVSSFELDRAAQSFSIKGELVKVHTSHLEELDEYILDLKSKLEEAEKRARTAEVALAVSTVKEAAKIAGTASALVKIGKEWVDSDQSRGQNESSPARIESSWDGNDPGSHCFQSPVRRQSKIGRQRNDVVGSNLRNLRHDQRWSGGTTENAQLWDTRVSSPGQDASSNSSSSGWMTVRGVTDDSFVMQDPFQQGPLTLAVSTPPPRSQRRWMVDAYWLENVRKEQTSLKQQLEIERQRVCALKQVEIENRWMEATIVEALEQKKDSDTRVLELERKVAFLESMISKKGVREKSPIASSVYRGAKS